MRFRTARALLTSRLVLDLVNQTVENRMCPPAIAERGFLIALRQTAEAEAFVKSVGID